MLKTFNCKRRGFTIVEIMIVVSIIALLAAIAIPNFVRARKRSQAASILVTFRTIDDAKAQYALENKVDGSTTIIWQEQVGYMKKGSPLYSMYVAGTVVDLLGNPVDDKPLDQPTTIPAATRAALDDVLGGTAAADEFWGIHK